jgi:hypothetical protein
MSVLQRTIRMFVLAAMAVSSHIGLAEDGYHPFSEPMEFDPDWQFFAPVQLQDMQDLTARQRANNGFFLTYDRMSVGVNRSDTEEASHAIDFTWGNRFDFGWMNSKESGWLFSASNISGPNAYNLYQQPRLNQFVTNAAGGNGPNGVNGPAITGTLPFIPPDFRNDVDGYRVYGIRDSINVGSFASFEANKTWRMEPYRYGGILEPMVGMRYAFFGDGAYNDTYTTSIVPLAPLPPLVAGQSLEQLTSNEVETNNYMLLGQAGFRYTKFINRWTLSNDMKFFGGHVYQNQTSTTLTTTTAYATPPGVGAVALSETKQLTGVSGRKDDASTIGFDLRVEGAYKATKYIDLRGGFGLVYFARGIARGATNGNPVTFSDNQNLIMPAFTFGAALNR